MEIILNRWSNLKKRAQSEIDPEKLIHLLGEIDELLAELEKKIAVQDENLCWAAQTDLRLDNRKAFHYLRLDGSGIWSQ